FMALATSEIFTLSLHDALPIFATLVPTERRSPREPELPPVIYAIPKPFTLWSPGRAFRLRNPIRRVHPPDRLVLQYQYVVALSTPFCLTNLCLELTHIPIKCRGNQAALGWARERRSGKLQRMQLVGLNLEEHATLRVRPAPPESRRFVEIVASEFAD